jgi:hypothetical protein
MVYFDKIIREAAIEGETIAVDRLHIFVPCENTSSFSTSFSNTTTHKISNNNNDHNYNDNNNKSIEAEKKTIFEKNNFIQ